MSCIWVGSKVSGLVTPVPVDPNARVVCVPVVMSTADGRVIRLPSSYGSWTRYDGQGEVVSLRGWLLSMASSTVVDVGQRAEL